MGILLTFSACKKEEEDPQKAIDHETIEKYAADQSLTGQFTESGLYYMVVKPGNAKHPTLSSVVTVSYKGYYLDGTLLDQGSMFTAPLNNLIAGWKEGLPYIGEGGKIKLVIPSHLAYNNGVLVFDVTLHYIQ